MYSSLTVASKVGSKQLWMCISLPPGGKPKCLSRLPEKPRYFAPAPRCCTASINMAGLMLSSSMKISIEIVVNTPLTWLTWFVWRDRFHIYLIHCVIQTFGDTFPQCQSCFIFATWMNLMYSPWLTITLLTQKKHRRVPQMTIMLPNQLHNRKGVGFQITSTFSRHDGF